MWERYVVEVEGWKREKDFVLIIERRVWRKGGRIEKAKRNLSRLVERGYLKKHMVELEGRKRFHIFVIVRYCCRATESSCMNGSEDLY